MELKPPVAATTFSLSTCQRILFMVLRMQKYWEILPNRAIAEFQHLFDIGTDDHPVVIIDGYPE